MSWISWGNIQTATRTNFGAIRTNSQQVFVIGGKCNLEGLKNCDIWDMETKRWSVGPSLPITMKFCRAVLFDRHIYVIGTYTDFLCLNIDNIGRGWKVLPDSKMDGLGCELVSDGNYIYRIGDSSEQTSMHRFNPEVEKWENLSKMDIGRNFLAAAVLGKKIYVTGGKSGHGGDKTLASLSIYDIAKDQWSSGPNLPQRLSSHSAEAVDNFIFVSGGLRGFGDSASSSCFLFNTETYEWTKLNSNLPRGFSGHSVIVWGTNVFIIGGETGQNNDKTHQIYTYDLRYALEDTDENATIQSNYTLSSEITNISPASKVTYAFTRMCCKSQKIEEERD